MWQTSGLPPRSKSRLQRAERPALRSDVGDDTAAVVSRRAAQRLNAGHVWVYRSDVIRTPKAEAGALVAVADERERILGTALYSSASQIALRVIARRAIAEGELTALLRQRLDAALAYRERFVHSSDAYRVVFSEADELPGLIVDRYSQIVSFQVLTQAFDRPELRQAVLGWIAEKLQPTAVVERVDGRIRELEKLPPREGGVVALIETPHEGTQRSHEGPRSGTAKTSETDDVTTTVITMNGVRFQVDALSGQKTGAFLDQRENYAAAERYARGEALDVFCYQGGFALHLARTCERVTAVDSSRPALEIAEQNEQLNRDQYGGREIEWMEANAFDLMRDYADAGQKYDTIVLDPPAFAKSQRNLPTALRGYKELNLRALKMLRPGGVLISCSCSYHVSESELVEVVASAARDAHRQVRILERRGAGLDHPAVPAIPETTYLKCLIVAVN